jgi:hypothetical protein
VLVQELGEHGPWLVHVEQEPMVAQVWETPCSQRGAVPGVQGFSQVEPASDALSPSPPSSRPLPMDPPSAAHADIPRQTAIKNANRVITGPPYRRLLALEGTNEVPAAIDRASLTEGKVARGRHHPGEGRRPEKDGEERSADGLKPPPKDGRPPRPQRSAWSASLNGWRSGGSWGSGIISSSRRTTTYLTRRTILRA